MSNHPDPKQDQSKQMGGTHQQGAYPLDQYTVAPKSQGGDGDKSPYYKSSAPTISLPKGGGALKGIDEKFTVNAVNGTASLQIPFPLTPGRGGFTPNLSVDYNSGSGNSEFGLGWNLSLPSIQRRTNKKLPVYNDSEESDVFLLAGAEDLIPKLDYDSGSSAWTKDEEIGLVFHGSTYDIRRYRPRIEGLFAKIEHIKKYGVPGSWWKVTTKENMVTFYGATADARLSDPEDENRIFKWLPQVSFDNKGNVQQYFYFIENNGNLDNVPLTSHENNRLNNLAPFTNIYLKSVKYCNRTPYLVSTEHEYDISNILPDDMVSNDFLMEVVLDYGNHDTNIPDRIPATGVPLPLRAEPFSDFHAGFEIRTYRRCMRVLMFHYFDELADGDPVLVRSVDFTYFLGAAPTALAEVDYITTFTQSGYMLNPAGGYFKKSLPPVTLTHISPDWDVTIHNVSREDAENAPQGLTGGYQWIDLLGVGLPGILSEQAHGWYYKENLGNGHFSPALQISPKPSLQGLGQALQWQDVEADGRRQLVNTAPEMPGYYELNDDQEWGNFRTFEHWINVDWSSPFTKTLDLNGDGRPDLLVTEDRVWRWYENEGEKGYTIGGEASFDYDEEKKPRLLLNDMVQSIFLADMNGDGMTDIVRIENGSICYWPNMGYGKFGAKVIMSNAPVFDRPDMFNPAYITLADISGTGAPDLIYIGQSKCNAWLNLSGNGWSDKKTTITLPEISPETKIGIMDFLGNGTACIVWSSPLPQHAHAPMRYIDLMGGNKPYLMDTYSNGMGKLVEVTYKQSTKYYLEDKQKGKPWATNLPFPVHCIEKIKTTDLVSQTSYTQVYSYHHGYYDHAEREFRGFGRVETIDTDKAVAFEPGGSVENDLNQHPVLTKTWNHTGAWMRERTLLEAFAEEYYPTGWAELPIVPDLPAGLTPQEQREAYRALKGQPLRQEVYALDGSPLLESVPYTVATHSYAVLKVQPVEDNLYGSFLSYQQQSLDWSAERNIADPRVAHKLTLEVDELGNVLKSAVVSYPRDLLMATAMVSAGASATPPVDLTVVRDVQRKMLATYSVNQFTNDVTINGYHLRVPYEARTYEVTGLSLASGTLWTPKTLSDQINGNTLLSIPPATEIEYADTPGTSVTIRQLSFARTLYLRNDTLIPLNLGFIESLGIPHIQYQLAFTDGILNGTDYYAGRVTATMLVEGGYLDDVSIGFPDIVANRYWIPNSGGVIYDIGNFYTPQQFIDPWNNTTYLSMWGSYYLLPSATQDAIGNITTVDQYNWYNLQPELVTDINLNQSAIVYDAVGMPVAAATMGKAAGPVEGDSIAGIDPNADITDQATFFTNPESVASTLLGGASWRCVYDLSHTPVAVGMIARETHYTDELATGVPSQLLIRLTYTDGLGRIAMNKVQAAPDEMDTTHTIRWIGNGKVIYNNKGNAVMQYEPYFTNTPLFDYESYAAAHGVTARIHYDALGRVLRTDLPDGTFTKAEWDGWTHIEYDNNDTVRDSDWFALRDTGALSTVAEENSTTGAAAKALKHHDTPNTIYLDTLGRAFFTIAHERVPDPVTPTTWNDALYCNYIDLDITSNRLAVNDARSLVPLINTYTLLKAGVKQISIDSGTTYGFSDVGGQHLYSWDAENRLFHTTYDTLRREIFKDVTYGTLPSNNRLQIIVYGEGQPLDTDNNLRGKPFSIKDGVGQKTIPHYDFKGNPLQTTEQLLNDGTIINVDWNSSPALSSEIFTGSTTFDAFNRPVITTDQGGNITRNVYDESGSLFSVHVTPILSGGVESHYVTGIYHDAKGQRLKIKYGNNTVTKYKYDPNTFRVTQILTTRPDPNPVAAPGSYNVVQDLNYWYDPVGNITLLRDSAQRSLFFNNHIILPDQDYTYSALYRLVRATGREQQSLAVMGSSDNYDDSGKMVNHPGDDTATQNYTQKYIYDAVGNILSLQHIAAVGGYTRNYLVSSANNRLVSTTVGSGSSSVTYSYTHDLHGNMDTMPHLTGMGWNLENHLGTVNLGGGGNAYYQYSGGERARKVLINLTGQKEERIYFGGFEIYRKFVSGSLTLERTTVHIHDDSGRIAMLEERTLDTLGTDPSPASLVRYIYSNNLGTASLELDGNAAIISYEEYHPYGTTAYQAKNSAITAVSKRYRYTGKERDDETGLYYHGARYYISWLARWSAVDPKEAEFCPKSPYNYCSNNPIMLSDPDGAEDTPAPAGGGEGGTPATAAGGDPAKSDDTNAPKPPSGEYGGGGGGTPSPETGLTRIIRLEDENGKPINIPDGASLAYDGGQVSWDPFKDKDAVTFGKTVISQPTGGAAMVTETITYRMGWGEKSGKISLSGYQRSYNSNEEDSQEGGSGSPTPGEMPKISQSSMQKLPVTLPRFTTKNIRTGRITNTFVQGIFMMHSTIAQEKIDFVDGLIRGGWMPNGGTVTIDFNYGAGKPTDLDKTVNSPNAFESYNPRTGRRTDTWQSGDKFRPAVLENITNREKLMKQLRQLGDYIQKKFPWIRIVVNAIRTTARNAMNILRLSSRGFLPII